MSKAATVAEKDRMGKIAEAGCICCLLESGKTGQAEVHHLTSGGRRRGHMFTVALCVYHHRGHLNGMSKQMMSGLVGPSYSWGRRQFQEHFGRDDFLLKIQNYILDEFTSNPWFDYQPPYAVVREAQHRWVER